MKTPRLGVRDVLADPKLEIFTDEGLPTDHDLHLTGLASRVIRGDLAITTAPPER